MHAPATQTEPPSKPRRSPLQTRIFWFLAGAGLNYLLISTPFKYLRAHSEFPPFLVSALSVGVASVFFFVWNLLVNFRTDSRKRDALARYCGAVCLMWLLSSSAAISFPSPAPCRTNRSSIAITMPPPGLIPLCWRRCCPI